MKIYKAKNGRFWFYQNKENGWFCFYSTMPNKETLRLAPGCFGADEEITLAVYNAIPVCDSDAKKFNRIAQMENNYNDICDFIRQFYPETTQKQLDDLFDYDVELIRLTNEIIDKSDKRKHIDGFTYTYEEIYRDVKQHMKEWGGDIDRVTNFVILHDIDKHLSYDHTLVDVWGKMHPTKRYLLHEFHGYWNMFNLEEHIAESVELYPDEKDYDKAYYYVKEKLNEEREKEIESLRKKKNERVQQ